MSISYRLLKASAFPDIKVDYSVPSQLSYLADKEVPATHIQRQHIPLQEGLESFYITHQLIVHQFGRAQNVEFVEYAAEFHLWAYYRQADGLLLIQGNKDSVADLCYTLNSRASEDFSLQNYEVDFQKLEPHLEVISGSWFRYKAVSLHAMGIFGNHVDTTAEYQTAKTLGTQTAINFYHTFLGADIPLQITRNAIVVIQANIESLPLEVEIVLDVKKTLLDKALNTVEKRRKKMPQ